MSDVPVLLVVFGATGKQGGSVINHVLSTPSLRSRYKLRGVTRNSTSATAQELQQKGVEMVTADVDEPSTLTSALAGSHTIFAMTFTIYDDRAKAREEQQGKAIADAAVACGAKYLIWSTEVDANHISGGKYPVDSFDSKYTVEAYIRTLAIHSAFVAPGAFLQSLAGTVKPSPLGDGTYTIANVHTPQAPFPWLDTATDMGKFVGVILADQVKYQGKVLAASSSIHSFDEVASKISAATGKTVRYSQIPPDVFRSYLPPAAGGIIVNMLLFIQDFGYYGPDTDKQFSWAIQQVGDQPLVTLDKFVRSIKLS